MPDSNNYLKNRQSCKRAFYKTLECVYELQINQFCSTCFIFFASNLNKLNSLLDNNSIKFSGKSRELYLKVDEGSSKTEFQKKFGC